MIGLLPTDLVRIIIEFVLPIEYVERAGFDMALYTHYLKTYGSLNTNPRVIADRISFGFIMNENIFYETLEMILNDQTDTDVSLSWLLPNLLSYPEQIARKWSSNTNTEAVSYLLENPDLIHWMEFSANTNEKAVSYALANLDRINWCMFSENTNTRAVTYLISHPEHIDWCAFSRNSNELAIEYVLKYPEQIQWYWLMENPSLFKAQRNHLESILFQDKYNAKIENVFLLALKMNKILT